MFGVGDLEENHTLSARRTLKKAHRTLKKALILAQIAYFRSGPRVQTCGDFRLYRVEVKNRTHQLDLLANAMLSTCFFMFFRMGARDD